MADARPEPSMEDILASIKRIIADDNPLPRRNYTPPPIVASKPIERAPLAPPPPPLPRAPFEDVSRISPRHDESILELTQPAPDLSPAHLQDQQKPWPPETIPAVSRVVERLRQSEAASAQARAASVSAVAPVAEPPSLRPLSAISGGITLDDLVRDMLRPMLSEWIDTHMPAIVERLVKQEINGTTDEQG